MTDSYEASENIIVLDKQVVRRYGYSTAHLLDLLVFWVTTNEYKKTNYHDGQYWTYNSLAKIADSLGVGTTTQSVRTSLRKLTEDKVVITGRYNKMEKDKTTWYAVDFKALDDIGFGWMKASAIKRIREYHERMAKEMSPLKLPDEPQAKQDGIPSDSATSKVEEPKTEPVKIEPKKKEVVNVLPEVAEVLEGYPTENIGHNGEITKLPFRRDAAEMVAEAIGTYGKDKVREVVSNYLAERSREHKFVSSVFKFMENEFPIRINALCGGSESSHSAYNPFQNGRFVMRICEGTSRTPEEIYADASANDDMMMMFCGVTKGQYRECLQKNIQMDREIYLTNEEPKDIQEARERIYPPK